MIRRHLVFVFVCALASAASSGLLLPPGLRAGWLGTCLALGIVFLNYKNGPDLEAGRAPSFLWVLPAGILAGLAAGVPLSFIGGVEGYDMFVTPKGWPMLLSAAAYGILVTAAYALRWRFASGFKRNLATVFSVLLGGWAAGALRASLLDIASGSPLERLGAGASASLITGVPFALFWCSAATGCDPAYTHERWAGTADPERTSWAAYLVVGLATMFFLGMGLPSMHSLIEESNGGATQGNLGSIRSALSIYYSDMQGAFPERLEMLTADKKYLPAIPPAKPGKLHPPSAEARTAADDAGGWVYSQGNVFVNCTHTDRRGSVWTSY